MTSTEKLADLDLVAAAAEDLRGMCSECGYREAVAVLVDATPALVDEIRQRRAQRQAVLALHREHGPTRNGIHCCLEDRDSWPCKTVQALGVSS